MTTTDDDGQRAPADLAPPRAALGRISPFRTRRSRGEWIADGLQFAVAILVWWFYGFLVTDSYPAIPDWYWPLDRVLGLLACLALWWARSYPVTVAVVVFVPATCAMSASFAALATVYRLGSHTRGLVAIGLTGVYLAAAAPYHAVFPVPEVTWAWWLTVLALIHLLALCSGMLARSRRLTLERLRADAARDRELFRARIAGARRDERERVAREMHDVLAHRVSLVSVHAGALEYRLDATRGTDDTHPTTGGTGAPNDGPAPPSSDEIREVVAVIRENAHLAVEELRQVLAVLRADRTADDDPIAQDHPQPRLTDLTRLVDDARRAGQPVTARLDVGSTDLPDAVQRTVFRVVQEGLTNARKHAPLAHVQLDVLADDDGARVRLVNPLPVGVGAGEIPGAGAGLTGLDERVRLDGGTFEHGVRDGEFHLTARIGSKP